MFTNLFLTMIKAQELRIGNYVLVDTRVAEVSEVLCNGVYLSVPGVRTGSFRLANYNDIDPIPLTPQWLERCGFEKGGFGAYNYDISPWPDSQLKQISFSGDYVYLREGDLKENRIKDGLVVLWNNDLRGKISVHQIQNLFHVLTGQELNTYKKKHPSI